MKNLLFKYKHNTTMIYEAIKNRGNDSVESEVIISGRQLFVQGVATSIDALSAGFAISGYSFFGALSAAVMIGTVTFAICLLGLKIGRTFGEKLADKAAILGGVILICIGTEILLF